MHEGIMLDSSQMERHASISCEGPDTLRCVCLLGMKDKQPYQVLRVIPPHADNCTMAPPGAFEQRRHSSLIVRVCNRCSDSLSFSLKNLPENPSAKEDDSSTGLFQFHGKNTIQTRSLSLFTVQERVLAITSIPGVDSGGLDSSSIHSINFPYTNTWLCAIAEPGAKQSPVSVLYRMRSDVDLDIVVYAFRNPATFLSSISDSTSLSSLCLPGTHESLALYGWPLSTCQSPEASIPRQLNDGVRYLDIRLAPKGLPGHERLLAYHGLTDERIELGKVLDECWKFLEGVGQRGEPHK